MLQLLRFTSASADVFPSLKSAAGGALHIAEIVSVGGFFLNENFDSPLVFFSLPASSS
jgi:hypothetical protein